MSLDLPSAGSPSTATPAPADRRCVACGYNLRGLGEEPRCPECGLLNIPAAFRREVWDLVDSGRWFFSSFFHPLRERPPGWWWALDRDGDVKRSVRAAARNLFLSSIIVFVCGGLSEAIVVNRSYRYVYSDGVVCGEHAVNTRAFSGLVLSSGTDVDPSCIRMQESRRVAGEVTFKLIRSSRISVEPSTRSLGLCTGIISWLLLTWAGPTFVGLSSQIRKGLPAFARAPRTIVAAGNYESHRLIYLAAAVAGGMLTQVFLQGYFYSQGYYYSTTSSDDLVWYALVIAVLAYAPAGWIGPLRSDYTRQLVRSRFHAGRIIIMYVLFLPLLGAIAVCFAPLLVSGWD